MSNAHQLAEQILKEVDRLLAKTGMRVAVEFYYDEGKIIILPSAGREPYYVDTEDMQEIEALINKAVLEASESAN